MEDRLRILLVEDVPSDAEIELRELRRGGVVFEARVVETEDRFRGELDAFAPDIVLSDFSLPHFDGLSALRIVREVSPDTPFIFVSGTIGEQSAIDALKSGATDYVLKHNLKRFAAAVLRAVSEAKEKRARAQAEARLRQAQRLFELFGRHMPGIWSIKDRDGRYVFVNDAMTAVVRRSVDDIVGRTTDELYPPDLAQLVREHERRVVDLGGVVTGHEMLPAHMGGRTYLAQRFPIRNEVGEFTHIGSVSVDITDRLAAEHALARSEERFRTIVETTEERIWECDLKCRMTYNNPALFRILGYAPEEVLGRSTLDFVDRESRKSLKRAAHRMLAEERGWRGLLVRARHKDGGTRWLESNGTPLFDSEGRITGFRGADRDVTERVQQEQRLLRLSRIRSVITEVNAAVARRVDREALLRETCRAAIDSGVFAGVWIGLRDPSAEELRFSESIGALLPPAGDGKVDVALPGLDFPALAEPALREREVLVHADLSAFLSPGATEAPAEAGIVCAAVAPLAMGRNVFGALAALAADEEFFGAEETNLLSNLAADLSFALDDVEKRKQLHYLAHYDTVSSLANRALLAERIGHFVQEASRSGEALALALMDLERFGAINDSFGRSAGDELLRQLGDRLREHFPSDHLARVGMNTFAVLFPRIREFLRVAGLVEDRLRAVFAKPFEAGGRVLNLSARFGISVFPADGEDVEALLRNAEAALRRAKAQGERFVYYEPALNANVAERLDLENRLRFALREEQFLLYYQPKIDAASGKVEGLEALIRWKPPDADPVSPGMFVPILEETGLILEVGRWVIHEAAKTYASWYRKYGAETPRIAVNVSALQMRRPDFAMDIVTLAEKAGAHNGLDVEITESVVMQEIELSTNALARLREVGVRIGMDDFGTGYSSLSYLARLPMDLLKIDRSFIASMMSNPENMEIVAAIVSMAHALKLSVVAEGVETQQQLDKLKSLDCDQIQGYLVSPPVSARAIERLLWGERAPSA